MQNRTTRKFSPRVSSSSSATSSKKKHCDAATNTTVRFVCAKCAERDQFNYTESEAFRASYLKSIDYINCCHGLMNELLYRKTGRCVAKLPDMPNFMDVLLALQSEGGGGGGGGFTEKGVVTDEKHQCDKSCGNEIVSNNTVEKVAEDYHEVQSDVSEEDMDRYAQELLLDSSNANTPRFQIFQMEALKQHTTPCCPPATTKQNKRPHLTNLNLLKQHLHKNNNDDENSDTDYIPSDEECDSPPKHQQQSPTSEEETTKTAISHPLKLNERSLHLLDENALNKIGLFTATGDLQVDAIKVLEAERQHRAKDARNKQFRRRRANSDTRAFEKRKFVTTDSAADLSDIKSESELEGVNAEEGMVKVVAGFKSGCRKT